MTIGLRSRQFYSFHFISLAIVIIFVAYPSAIQAQLPVKQINVEKGETKPEKVETSEQLLERLEQLLSKARQSLNSAQPVLETTPPEQLGATEEEIKEKQFLLFNRIFLYSNHIESLRGLEETRHASEDLAAKSEAWQGFEQPPPYPISLVDELRDSVHARSLAIMKDEIRKNLIDQEQDEARDALATSEKQLRQIKESLEKTLMKDEHIRTDWLHELAILKNEVAQAKVLTNKAQLQSIDGSLSLNRKKKSFLERQILVAVADAFFSEEELEQKLAPLKKQLTTLDKEKRKLSRENNRNQEKLHRARGTLQKTRETLTQKGVEQGQTEEINYLQQVVETRKVQADSSAQLGELQKLWTLGIKGEIFLWEERYRLANRVDDSGLKQTANSLQKRLEKILENRAYIESNLLLTQNLLANEEKRLSSGSLAEKEQALIKQKVDVYKQQINYTNRLLIDVDGLVRDTQRFQDEVAYYRQEATAGERLQGVFERSLKLVGTIWNYELFVVEDTISVNGQSVTAQRPVTISKVVRALLILIIGFWLTTLLKFRCSSLMTKIFKVDASAALLIEKFLQTVTIFILLIVALITVKIPLTAFAFMGGALAIGVGFGAQALINNFISGIILLFERPIKAGDRVEVEGTKGRVVSIGLRCSQVRRYDGVDILVPNSDFLQKSVINWTLTDQLIRLQVTLGVAYGSPTREVSRIIDHALSEHGKILKTPDPIILFEEFGDSALMFSVYFWVEVQESYDYRIIASDLRHMLDKRLDEANITIAFPQLDVHLHSTNMKTSLINENQGEGSQRK